MKNVTQNFLCLGRVRGSWGNVCEESQCWIMKSGESLKHSIAPECDNCDGRNFSMDAHARSFYDSSKSVFACEAFSSWESIRKTSNMASVPSTEVFVRIGLDLNFQLIIVMSFKLNSLRLSWWKPKKILLFKIRNFKFKRQFCFDILESFWVWIFDKIIFIYLLMSYLIVVAIVVKLIGDGHVSALVDFP